MSDTYVFPPPSIVTDWSWDGSLSCPVVIPLPKEQTNMTVVEDDTESILLRTIRLRKSQASAAQKPKVKPIKSVVQEPNTTFLPAPIHKMTQPELKTVLKNLGMSTAGSRGELAQRLENFMARGKK
jgi:hypothetical protein